MSNVQNPTYFLAPNWNFPPGGKIAIGNIVRNPLKPDRILTKPGSNDQYATTTSTEKNWRLSVETSANLSLSLWAVFLEKTRISISGSREKMKSSSFTMDSLDTIYLSEDPSSEEIKARCNNPLVREYMRLDSSLCSPVYMITGIKVAKGFKLEGEKSSSKSVEGEVGGEVSVEVSLGAKAGAGKTNRITDGFESAGDIIFAYQVMKIKPKGWSKEKKLEISDLKHKAAFLESGKKQDEEEVDGEWEVVSRDDAAGLTKVEVATPAEGFTVAYEKPKEL